MLPFKLLMVKPVSSTLFLYSVIFHCKFQDTEINEREALSHTFILHLIFITHFIYFQMFTKTGRAWLGRYTDADRDSTRYLLKVCFRT